MEEAIIKEKLAEEWLVFLGKLIRRIDEEMIKNNKKPISGRLLAKDNLKSEDILKIVSEIFKRYNIYVNDSEKEKIRFNGSSDNVHLLIEGLNELEKKNKIKLCVVYGYFYYPPKS